MIKHTVFHTKNRKSYNLCFIKNKSSVRSPGESSSSTKTHAEPDDHEQNPKAYQFRNRPDEEPYKTCLVPNMLRNNIELSQCKKHKLLSSLSVCQRLSLLMEQGNPPPNNNSIIRFIRQLLRFSIVGLLNLYLETTGFVSKTVDLTFTRVKVTNESRCCSGVTCVAPMENQNKH
ncbi:hypothetical protein YC2023_114486 [Brassica napus]